MGQIGWRQFATKMLHLAKIRLLDDFLRKMAMSLKMFRIRISRLKL